LATLLSEARAAGGLSITIAETAQAVSEEVQAEADAVEPEPEAPQTMSLFGSPAEAPAEVAAATPVDVACKLGLAANSEHAIEVSLEHVKAALEDATLPKRVHDLKAVLRALEPHGIMLAGGITDVMLQSYLLNPTHGSHTLVDIAARSTSRALLHQATKANPNDPLRLPEAASAVAKLAEVLGEQMAEGRVEHVIQADTPELGGALTAGMLWADKGDANKRRHALVVQDEAAPLDENSSLPDVYRKLDLPLVPVLLRMEKVGVRVDLGVLGEMGSRLGVMIDDLAERVYASSGHRFNINSPKQLGEVLFTKMDLPKPMKYGKGKVISTAQDILEDLAQHHEVPALVLEHRQLQKLKSTYLDQLPKLWMLTHGCIRRSTRWARRQGG
jgi:DNA polymerase-1